MRRAVKQAEPDRVDDSPVVELVGPLVHLGEGQLTGVANEGCPQPGFIPAAIPKAERKRVVCSFHGIDVLLCSLSLKPSQRIFGVD
jgi:hypothetical protein